MKKDIVKLFQEIDELYPELDNFRRRMDKQTHQIYDLYLVKYGQTDGHTLYMDNSSIVGTKAWFKENSKSYTTIDVKGTYFLSNGFILGVIHETVARTILNKHLKKHDGKIL